MIKNYFSVIVFVLALTLISHVRSETLGHYLFQKSIDDRSFFEPRNGTSKVFDRVSNYCYASGLKLGKGTGNTVLYFKNKTMLSCSFEFDRPDIRKSNTEWHRLSFPNYNKLFSVTLEKNIARRKQGMYFIHRWQMPIEKDTFETRRKRVVDFYADEFFTKSVVLWHQDCWPRLSNMPTEQLKENVFLFTSFDFPLRLEETDQDLNSMANPFIELTADDVQELKMLQQKIEKEKPGSTKRPEVEWSYWTGRPLGTPEFEGSLKLDPRTGFLSVNLFHPTPDVTKASAIRVDLDKNFGYQNDKDFFRNTFSATSLSGKVFESKNEKNADNPPSVNRIFDLEDNEAIGKECKIWEIAIWPELFKELKENRNEKIVISYPISVELRGIFENVPLNDEGFSTVPHEEVLELTLDYVTLLKMEQLKIESTLTNEKSDEKVPAGFRVWQSADGLLKVTAKIVAINADAVKLESEKGDTLNVELHKLRKEDQEYVKLQNEMEAAKKEQK